MNVTSTLPTIMMRTPVAAVATSTIWSPFLSGRSPTAFINWRELLLELVGRVVLADRGLEGVDEVARLHVAIHDQVKRRTASVVINSCAVLTVAPSCK